jgi:hypothetical protein
MSLELATLDLSRLPRLSPVERVASGDALVLCRHPFTLAARSDNLWA